MDPEHMIVEDPWWAFCPHQPHREDKPQCIACPMNDECPVDLDHAPDLDPEPAQELPEKMGHMVLAIP